MSYPISMGTPMILRKIEKKVLEQDKNIQAMWFNAKDAEVYIRFTLDTIHHFEITLNKEHLVGGYQSMLRYGNLSEGVRNDIAHKPATIVNQFPEIPDDFFQVAIHLVNCCEDIEERMRDMLVLYLNSKGANQNALKSLKPFNSFDP